MTSRQRRKFKKFCYEVATGLGVATLACAVAALLVMGAFV